MAEMNARIQDAGNAQPAPRALPVPAAPATRPAPTNPPAVARAPDLSIAKARAANVYNWSSWRIRRRFFALSGCG
jgi:hypothetical protein